MSNLKVLFENNRGWAKKMLATDPEFFSRLSHLQKPKYLWIGCSDSRVPANEITGLFPGELFVHRNVANIVVHTDLNCLSVLQYAVEVLHVKHVIVCGHYGCGGIQAAFEKTRLGLIDNWLRHIVDVQEKYSAELNKIKNKGKRFNRLCELNTLEQARNISETSIVQDAWKKGTDLTVHALIYDLHDGLLKDLFSVDGKKRGK